MKLIGSTKRALCIGSAVGLLNMVIANISISDRSIEAPTSYPYIAGILFDPQSSTYFNLIDIPGSWEMWFVLGGLTAGYLYTLIYSVALPFQQACLYALLPCNLPIIKNSLLKIKRLLISSLLS